MTFLNNYSKGRIFLFTISLILILSVVPLLSMTNQIAFTNDESSTMGFDIQIPKESDVYYRDTVGNAWDVYMSEDYAYVADGRGLAIIDISDPTNPGTPVYKNLTGDAYGIQVSGDYAYVSDFFDGLAIIDISDPTNPGTPVYMDTNGIALDICVDGDYAYLANENEGLVIIDISDPTNPGTPVYEDTTGDAKAVHVSGDYAYVADGESGLAIIDISAWIALEKSPVVSSPVDITVETDYTGQNILWTPTDSNPSTYTIELNGSGIVAGPTTWVSGTDISFDITDGFAIGVYKFTVNFTDTDGNFRIDSILFRVEEKAGIPGARFELILLISMISVVSIIIVQKKKHD